MDLEAIKRVAVAAAYRGAEVLKSYFGRIADVKKKSAIDLVTEADTAAEDIIIKTIRSGFSDHTFLAEESGLIKGSADNLWIIDPLDGTTNFTHQLGIFGISIAFALNGEVTVGIVLNPISGELFTATCEKGAFLNGKPIKVSSVESVSESLLVTGFPYNLKDFFNPIMIRYRNCLKASQGVRRLGSAALDLCFVACGRFEAFWEQNLNPWDTAAGWLVVKEAGGVITDFSNNPFTIDQKEILATNGLIHNKMLSLLKIKDPAGKGT